MEEKRIQDSEIKRSYRVEKGEVDVGHEPQGQIWRQEVALEELLRHIVLVCWFEHHYQCLFFAYQVQQRLLFFLYQRYMSASTTGSGTGPQHSLRACIHPVSNPPDGCDHAPTSPHWSPGSSTHVQWQEYHVFLQEV